jgi:hypothetical protein
LTVFLSARTCVHQACAFLAHAVARAIHCADCGPPGGSAAFLNGVVREYLELLGAQPAEDARSTLMRLLRSEEGDESLERVWRWRDPCAHASVFVRTLLTAAAPAPVAAPAYVRQLANSARLVHCSAPGIERTLQNRGHTYNGYPVSAGYFGAFSLDGLAIALHCVYHTHSFNEAIVKCAPASASHRPRL